MIEDHQRIWCCFMIWTPPRRRSSILPTSCSERNERCRRQLIQEHLARLRRCLSKIQFPAVFTSEAEEVVRSLCRKKPEDRIVMQRGGLSNLSELPFFADLDWEEVANHKFPAPFQPEGADYTKIGNRQLSSSFEIEWEELVPWLFDAEEDLEKHHQETPQALLSILGLSIFGRLADGGRGGHWCIGEVEG
ncbi:Serine/threonine-protein kinase SCH9 [Durusdinium trenchii]|uniref:Serine/threonine-protein kinase SCH9 n=1 Tax=Durusdinium trenchii TaxID=1381693 RepID=A0ABP0JU62_9DINO